MGGSGCQHTGSGWICESLLPQNHDHSQDVDLARIVDPGWGPGWSFVQSLSSQSPFYCALRGHGQSGKLLSPQSPLPGGSPLSSAHRTTKGKREGMKRTELTFFLILIVVVVTQVTEDGQSTSLRLLHSLPAPAKVPQSELPASAG